MLHYIDLGNYSGGPKGRFWTFDPIGKRALKKNLIQKVSTDIKPKNPQKTKQINTNNNNNNI